MFNKIILIGNITREIELRYSQSGTAIAKTGLATNRRRRDASGKNIDESMFIDIIFFGRSGEIANQYLRKGSKVLIEGRLQLEQWVDNNNHKQSKHSVIVENMQLLDASSGSSSSTSRSEHHSGARENQSSSNNGTPKSSQAPRDIEEEIDEDEIPF